MKMRALLAGALVLFLVAAARADQLAEVVRQAMPSVCYLLSAKEGGIAAGTATVVHSTPTRSILLTARHVVQEATAADCIFLGGARTEGGTLHHPTQKGLAHDWALIETRTGNLKAVRLTTAVTWAEPVTAITMASNIPFLVFSGRVSRPTAAVPGEPDMGPVILLDMASFRGASGSLVLNERGEGVAVISSSYIVHRKLESGREHSQQLVAIGVPLAPVIEKLAELTKEAQP